MFQRQFIPPERIPDALVAKWGKGPLLEGYVPFPKKLLRCLPAIFGEGDGLKKLQVVLAVVDYLRPNLSRGPSLEFLAFLTGLEKEEVKTQLKNLRSEGLLEIDGTEAQLTISTKGLQEKIIEMTNEKDRPEEEIAF